MTAENTGGRSFRDRIVSDYEGYKVYDRDGEKLGKVEYTVLDNSDQPQYLGIKTGFFGSNTTLIPEEIISLDSSSNEFSVQATASQVNDAPTISDEGEVSSDFENDLLSHYGLGGSGQGSSGAAGGVAQDTGSSNDRDRDYDDRSGGQDYDAQSESRGGSDYDRDRPDREDQSRDQDRDLGRSGSSTGEAAGAASGAAAGGAAAGAATSGSRDQEWARDRDRNTGSVDENREGRSSSSRRDDEEGGEKIQVTLKREEAHAERIVNEDGEEEVRIRKRTLKEEVLIDVVDVEGPGGTRH